MTTAEDSASPSEQVAFSSEYFSENESLSEHEIVWVWSAASGSHTTGPQPVMPAPTTFLECEPDQIRDVFSSVLGDVFHFMDRVRVPMHHELKKAYFYSLSEAFFGLGRHSHAHCKRHVVREIPKSS